VGKRTAGDITAEEAEVASRGGADINMRMKLKDTTFRRRLSIAGASGEKMWEIGILELSALKIYDRFDSCSLVIEGRGSEAVAKRNSTFFLPFPRYTVPQCEPSVMKTRPG
jgi:hypothetical protein